MRTRAPTRGQDESRSKEMARRFPANGWAQSRVAHTIHAWRHTDPAPVNTPCVFIGMVEAESIGIRGIPCIPQAAEIAFTLTPKLSFNAGGLVLDHRVRILSVFLDCLCHD